MDTNNFEERNNKHIGNDNDNASSNQENESRLIVQFDKSHVNEKDEPSINQSHISILKDNDNDNDSTISNNNQAKNHNDIKKPTEANDVNDLSSVLTTSKIKKTIDSLCLFVFLNYSNFNNDDRDFFISLQALHKLLNESGILSKSSSHSSLNINQLDLMLKTLFSNKKISKLDSTQFFKLVVLLANRELNKEFNTNPKQALLTFTQRHFEPIVINIKKNTSSFIYYSIEQRINSMTEGMIDTNTNSLFNSIYKSLMAIYKIYFPLELSHKGNKQTSYLVKESLRSLIELCKDYSLCPVLISIEKVAIIYNCIIDQFTSLIKLNNETIGKVFTLQTLCKFLLLVADISFNDESSPLYERVLMLFEKMESSNGMTLTRKKTSIGSLDNFSLSIDHITLKEILMSNRDKANTINNKDDTIEETNIVYKESHRNKNQSNREDNTTKDKESQYNDLLEEFFETYSSIGDKMTFSQMTLTSFLKLLKDFGVFEIKRPIVSNLSKNKNLPQEDYLSESEVCMIYFQLCGRKSRNESNNYTKAYTHISSLSSSRQLRSNRTFNSKTLRIDTNANDKLTKMTYDLFLQALNTIAIKLHPNIPIQEAILLFKSKDLALDQSLEKPERGVTQLEDLITSINNSDMKSIIFDFQSSLNSLYSSYADSNSLIDFHSFFLFYKDFSIFPDTINLIEIKKMFFILLQIQTEGLKPNNVMSSNTRKTSVLAKYKSIKYDTLMTFDYFLYSIAIASRFVKGRDTMNEYEKIVYLLSKMMRSKGMNGNTRQLATGNRSSTCTNCTTSAKKDMIEMLNIVKGKYSDYFPQTDSKIQLVLKSDYAYEKLFEEC